jgi:hypothetical protein
MKKWITLLTCAACTFSSVTFADDLPPNVQTVPLADSEPAVEEASTMTNDTAVRKPVGKAADDGSKTAGSGAGKYVLAGAAIAAGITALLLVSRHSGHHKHKKHH